MHGLDLNELNQKLAALYQQRKAEEHIEIEYEGESLNKQENAEPDDQQQKNDYTKESNNNLTDKKRDHQNNNIENENNLDNSNLSDQLTFLQNSQQKQINNLFASRNFFIGDFEIYSTLGTGTFGRVKQVRLKQDSRGQVYALKMMKKIEIVKLKQVEHIKSEKRILQEITHPFLVSLKTTFQDEKYVYMLFEFVSGGELFSRLRKDGRFSNDIALFYVSEIFLALQYLHKKNYVYRDLKPENLLIDKDGHIKIADFGFAKKMDSSRTYTLCGTPEYLAPEIIQGAKTGYGKSVDWWALGVLIYEMLSGHPPFYDHEPMGIYKKILNSVIEFPLFFSLRAKDIIRKLLNPIVENRLGCQDDGEAIKKHKWFKCVSWREVVNKQIPAPWIPFLKNESDVSWFEKYPESKDEAKSLPREYNHLFDDF